MIHRRGEAFAPIENATLSRGQMLRPCVDDSSKYAGCFAPASMNH
jgi:hypothetical protein